MKQIIHVSIGIPAYNESANIGELLKSLQKQVSKSYLIDMVIVYSDGSTDDTTKIARTIKGNYKVEVIDNKNRLGLAGAQNKIFSICESDVLVLLQADIRVSDQELIEKLVKKIAEGTDLVSGDILEVAPKSKISNILQHGMEYKREVFTKYRNGQNFFTCHGPIRAFSKKLYKSIRFEQSAGEDLYSYLFCKFNGFIYSYEPDAIVYYRLPENFSEHKNQSRRFFLAREWMKKKFGKEFVEQETRWPYYDLMRGGLAWLLKNPIESFAYVLICFFMVTHSKVSPDIIGRLNRWEMVKSTKII
jgi:glycosyltransferase involved in cell wall biosynthesis